MTRMSIGLRSSSPCSAGTRTQSCTIDIRLISFFSVATSVGGTSRTIIHVNVRMHQHFMTTFRLGKKRPSASLNSFKQIG